MFDWRRERLGIRAAAHFRSDVRETFRAIYDGGVWVHATAQQSRSGVGSEVAATKGLVEGIEAMMAHLGCRSLVDVGCGDWNWLKRSDFNFDYVGVDVVPEVVERNAIYARNNVRFQVVNAISDPLPLADVALCREVLFHLSFADARKVIRNIATSAKYLCATTDFDILFNSDICTGDFRAINLVRRPFRFPIPLCLVADQGQRTGRYLAVWSCRTLS